MCHTKNTTPLRELKKLKKFKPVFQEIFKISKFFQNSGFSFKILKVEYFLVLTPEMNSK